MKALQKKLLVTALGISNLAVLGMIFHMHFDSQQSLRFFSRADNAADLRDKIQTECKEELEALSRGERNWFNCSVRLNRRQKGAAYTLKTEVKVNRKSNGTIQFEALGTMLEKSSYATEADFCNTCTKTEQVSGERSWQEIMEHVTGLAESIYNEAEDSVNTVRDEYNTKDREKRLALLKERKCLGSWNENSESYEEFDTEEKLKCKIKRAGQIDALEIEDYYHEDLKKTLWQIALEDEDHLLEEELLDMLSNPYKFPLSVQASVGLLKNYSSNWKEDYEALNSLTEQAEFISNIREDVFQTAQLMTKEQFQTDLFYLNKSFDKLLVNLQAGKTSIPQLPTPGGSAPQLTAPGGSIPQLPTPSQPAIDYDQVRRQTQELYQN